MKSPTPVLHPRKRRIEAAFFRIVVTWFAAGSGVTQGYVYSLVLSERFGLNSTPVIFLMILLGVVGYQIGKRVAMTTDLHRDDR